MRKAIIVIFAAALIAAASALAYTNTITGMAFNSKPLSTSFTTTSAGAVSVNATWVPANGKRYVLTVKHLMNLADSFSYDQICQVYEPLDGTGSGQTVGDYTCSFAAGETGFWTAEFRPITGKTTATLTITVP